MLLVRAVAVVLLRLPPMVPRAPDRPWAETAWVLSRQAASIKLIITLFTVAFITLIFLVFVISLLCWLDRNYCAAFNYHFP